MGFKLKGGKKMHLLCFSCFSVTFLYCEIRYFLLGGKMAVWFWITGLKWCNNFDNLMSVVAAESKTQPNRYLLIATSGGLNQQRTGVKISTISPILYAFITEGLWICTKGYSIFNINNISADVKKLIRQTDGSILINFFINIFYFLCLEPVKGPTFYCKNGVVLSTALIL